MSSRIRLACAACTRRKVKCSKTIPCNNCERRGEQAICSIENVLEDPPSPIRPSSSREHEIAHLQQRIAELQQTNSRAGTSLDNVYGISPQESRTALEDEHVAAHLHARQPSIEPGTETCDSVAQDAASILEFLAWGRRKDPDFHAVVSPELDSERPRGEVMEELNSCSPLSILQLLLPSRIQVRQLVDYHCEALLWYHGSFFAPTFRNQLEAFQTRHESQILSPGVNLQWVALLFSIMVGSLTCAPASLARSWGYRSTEQATLSKHWFKAIAVCLNSAEYTTNLSIFSCQAIATGTIAAHPLGFSSSQSIHLAAAVRIAQSLGLHRLNSEASGNATEKEIGRRVWTQLCSQDWFGIPFSESYLINPIYSTSKPPANCHDHELVPLASHIPTITSYSRFLYDIAAIMPQLQDDLMSCNTAYTRYEQVLKWDSRLRSLAIQERPAFLSTIPLEPEWPAWIPWARRALAISSSHKIIMIHRSFLSDSFTNPAFGFTRRTCLAASTTIIKEYKQAVEENGPILWIHQAFAVAAAIIITLDMLHRNRQSQEHADSLVMVKSVVQILASCNNSTIACRGVKLLEALLAEVAKIGTTLRGTKRTSDGTTVRAFDVLAFVKAYQDGQQPHRPVTQVTALQDANPTYDFHNTSEQYETDPSQFYMEPTFAPIAIDGLNGFENLLFLANHDFTTL